jgi:2-polyprenyl-3-methyl-5-hydroxy-6-metoxy-1,4-benzoquinol methylase
MQFATAIEIFCVRLLEAIGRIKITLVGFLSYEMKNAWTLDRSTYGGLVMRCAPGTHEAAVSLLLRHDVPRRSVLDLGSGSGAMLARFRDLGFTQLHAVERNLDRFQLADIKPLAIDLNTNFCQRFDRRFFLISAIEIIEHLDSPRHFLRQVLALLDEHGYLLLTTPNVSHWVGRILFFLRGELRWFEETHYYRGHVSPITDGQMRLMLKENGFDLVESTSAGSFFGPLKHLALAPISLCFRALFGHRTWGDINIYLAKKSNTETAV